MVRAKSFRVQIKRWSLALEKQCTQTSISQYSGYLPVYTPPRRRPYELLYIFTCDFVALAPGGWLDGPRRCTMRARRRLHHRRRRRLHRLWRGAGGNWNTVARRPPPPTKLKDQPVVRDRALDKKKIKTYLRQTRTLEM